MILPRASAPLIYPASLPATRLLPAQHGLTNAASRSSVPPAGSIDGRLEAHEPGWNGWILRRHRSFGQCTPSWSPRSLMSGCFCAAIVPTSLFWEATTPVIRPLPSSKQRTWRECLQSWSLRRCRMDSGSGNLRTGRSYHVASSAARLAARLFPKWALAYKGDKLLRCPPARIFAMETLRIAPPQPWAFNSGFANGIAAESLAMIEYAAEAGLPRDRMTATGSPSDDAMFKVREGATGLRYSLNEELGLPPDRPMILTALPPDFLYVNGGRPQCDFAKYDEMIEFWIGTLSDQNIFNVVVALHPSVKYEFRRVTSNSRAFVFQSAGRRILFHFAICMWRAFRRQSGGRLPAASQ